MLCLDGVGLLPSGCANGDVAGEVDARAAVDLKFFEGFVEFFFREFRLGAKFVDGARIFAEHVEDLVEMIGGRVVAIVKEVVSALIGVGVHKESAARRAIAAGATDFLVIAFEGARKAGVDDGADVGFVDAHAEGDGGDDNFKLSALKGALHALAGFCIEAGVICGSGHQLRQLFGKAFRLLARCGVDDGWTAIAMSKKRANGTDALRHGKLNDFNGEVVAAEAMDEARRIDHAQLGGNVGLHRWRRRRSESKDRNRI